MYNNYIYRIFNFTNDKTRIKNILRNIFTHGIYELEKINDYDSNHLSIPYLKNEYILNDATNILYKYKDLNYIEYKIYGININQLSIPHLEIFIQLKNNIDEIENWIMILWPSSNVEFLSYKNSTFPETMLPFNICFHKFIDN